MDFIAAISAAKKFKRPHMPNWLVLKNVVIKEEINGSYYIAKIARTDYLAKDWEIYQATGPEETHCGEAEPTQMEFDFN